MAWHVMSDYDEYDTARADFAWDLPEDYNPAVDCLRKHEDPRPPGRTALVDAATDETYTFRDIDEASGCLANVLESLGVDRGDRVGVITPQRPETPIAHLACWKVGAVTVPMTTLFGRDAISYRINDAGVRGAIFDSTVRKDLAEASRAFPVLETVVELEDRPWYVGEPETSDSVDFECDVVGYEALGEGRSSTYEPHDSTPSTDTAIMYTSGSTGPPKGVRHGHGLWAGRAPAAYNFFEGKLDADTVAWTPADWAWGSALGGLYSGPGTTVARSSPARCRGSTPRQRSNTWSGTT